MIHFTEQSIHIRRLVTSLICDVEVYELGGDMVEEGDDDLSFLCHLFHARNEEGRSQLGEEGGEGVGVQR